MTEEQTPLRRTPDGLKAASNWAIAALGLIGGLGSYLFLKRYIVEAYATESEMYGYGATIGRAWHRLAIRDSETQAEQVIAEMKKRLPGGMWLGCFRVVEVEPLPKEHAAWEQEPAKEKEE